MTKEVARQTMKFTIIGDHNLGITIQLALRRSQQVYPFQKILMINSPVICKILQRHLKQNLNVVAFIDTGTHSRIHIKFPQSQL